MKPFLATIAVVLGALAATGCSAAGDGSEFGGSGEDDGSSGDTGLGATSSGGIDGSGSTGSGGLPSDCSVETTYIYVVGFSNELVRFDPKAGTFELVGTLACPGTGGAVTPFSMAVQRNGTAWVLFSDGRLFHASIDDASCSPTSFAPNQAGFTTFGMAFVSDVAGSATETLYVAQGDAGGQGNTLGKIDTATMQLVPIGPYDQLSTAAELTGNASGDLFGFFRTAPITVAQIDKLSASILDTGQPAIGQTMVAWAFAFWGGDFWLFSDPYLAGSSLDRFSLQSLETQNVSGNIGFSAVGAGVSTCAPLTIPE